MNYILNNSLCNSCKDPRKLSPMTKVISRLWIILLLLPVLYLGFHIPIYSDEVTWKIMMARLWRDLGMSITTGPQCGKSFSVSIPLLFLPFRAFDSWLYEDLTNLIKLRILGGINFIFWIGATWLLCKKLFKANSIVSNLSFLGVIFVCCLGILPFGMLMNRPEQPLLISLTLLLLLPFLENKTAKQRGILIFSYLFLCLFFLSQHPKSLMFFPVLLIILKNLSASKKAKIASLLPVLFAAGTTYHFSMQKLSCPLSFRYQQTNASMGLSPSNFLKDPLWWNLKQIVKNMIGGWHYFGNILFSKSYMSNWLPPNNHMEYGSHIINCFIVLILSCLSLGSIVFCIQVISQRKKHYLESIPFQIGCNLIISMVFITIVQTTKHQYESHLMIPLLTLGTLLLFASFLETSGKIIKSLNCGIIILGIISFLSVINLIHEFYPFKDKEWTRVGSLEGMNLSVSAFNFKEVENRVMALKTKCNLGAPEKLKHLVIDDKTYPFFWKSNEPFHALYVMRLIGWGVDEDTSIFLSKHQSAGIICQCRALDANLLAVAHREGDLCCLPAFK